MPFESTHRQAAGKVAQQDRQSDRRVLPRGTLAQRGRALDYVAYRAVLVPRLWWLSLTYQSRSPTGCPPTG